MASLVLLFNDCYCNLIVIDSCTYNICMFLSLNHSSFIIVFFLVNWWMLYSTLDAVARLHSWRVCASGCTWGHGDAPEKLQQLVPWSQLESWSFPVRRYEHHRHMYVCMHDIYIYTVHMYTYHMYTYVYTVLRMPYHHHIDFF